MGRSVSYARGSIAKVYYDVGTFGYLHDDDGNRTNEYNDWLGRDEWDMFKAGLIEDIKALWPSFETCDKWLANEDLAFMENRFAYIGLSEYCGCACLWLVPKESDGYYADDIKLDNLAKGWANRIAPKFKEKFGEFVRIGGFSNGESIYERKVK